MNVPIRRLSLVVALLFTLLLASTTYAQYFDAQEVRDMPGNRRTFLTALNTARGAILVDGRAVAESAAVDDGDRRYLRKYSNGPMYAPVTGYFSFQYGADRGLEYTENGVLSGSDDSLFLRRTWDVLLGRPRTGANVETTLDATMQRAAYDAMRGRTGAVVALDAKTGQVLAMVSTPSYDPNVLEQDDAQQQWIKIMDDAERPMSNRVRSELYPPGSTFKLITAAAAMKDGAMRPDSQVYAPDQLTLPQTTRKLRNFADERCSNGGDHTSLRNALRVSCNTAFGDIALKLGPDKLRNQAEAFGFGTALKPPLRSAVSRMPDNPTGPLLAYAGIGQGDVRVTPLQVAMVAAGIANGGVVMKPQIVKAVRDSSLDTISESQPEQLSTATTPEVAAGLQEMMKAVVDSGTGRGAAVRGYDVYGKTGTAETAEKGKSHAWFTGFIDLKDRRVAIAVLVESVEGTGESATGGAVAAPIARAVFQAAVRQR